ncbi:YibE/F family protein [Plantactinospora sonchi]|uniref:YibE/F family protein n=1 Tax=Plantactinospora sonchi TaxID=1544735 RepID=A0ABU7S4K3_9ACTN
MGADHHRPPPPAPPRLRKILIATVVPLFAATCVGVLLLWPSQAPTRKDAPPVPRYHGTVTRVVVEPCPEVPDLPEAGPAGADGPCGTVRATVDEGPDAGREVETPIPVGPGAPEVAVGDEVILVQLTDPADPSVSSYNIADQQRGRPLVWLLAAFAVAIVAFGRLRGLAALAGLAASFGILLTFILPAILEGSPPLLVAVTGAALIMFVVLYLTHGVTTQTSVAVLGTLGSLLLTGVLGTVAIGATHLTGFGSEDATTLSFLDADVDLHGLLLAGIIIGSLGVLDDVTVTQAATVGELARANPDLTRRQLYQAATRVGRAHIASTVNTIILAYAGASLPLLLLLIAGGRATSEILTTEFMAQEIVRSAVATLGLIAAVPITTALAAVVTTAGRRRAEQREVSRPPDARGEALAALAGSSASADPRPDPAGWEPDRN